MGRTACTEPQCLYTRAIPLLPLWAVQPVQSLSGACTVQLYLYSPYGPYCLYTASVPVQYSYTSTPPMGRAACTEPQCLYKGVLHLYFTDILRNSRNRKKLSRYSEVLRPGRSRSRIPVRGEIFRTLPERPWGPSSLLYNVYLVIPGIKRRSVEFTTHPLYLRR